MPTRGPPNRLCKMGGYGTGDIEKGNGYATDTAAHSPPAWAAAGTAMTMLSQKASSNC